MINSSASASSSQTLTPLNHHILTSSTPKKQSSNEGSNLQLIDKNLNQEHRKSLSSIVDNIQTKLSLIEKSFDESNNSQDISMRQIDDKKKV